MPQAYVDPQSLRQFADELRQFNEFIEETLADLNQKINRLGQTWRDQEYEKFMRVFQGTKRLLESFSVEASAIIPQLENEAELAEKFHKIQM